MAISLRIVIGLLTAVTVLVVASTTLAITYTVSINAIRDAGDQLAASISATVDLEVTTFIQQAENDALAIQNLTRFGDTYLPPDDPQYGTEDWGNKYLYAMRGMLQKVNYTYSSLTIIFMDGSVLGGLDHQNARGWYTEAVQTNRRLANGTEYRTFRQSTYNINSKALWVDAQQGGAPPRTFYDQNARVPAVDAVIGFVASQEVCLWFQPTVDNNQLGNPRFVLYGQCLLFNQTGTMLGLASTGRFIDTLPDFLSRTTKTPNTQIMLIDNFRLLLASTYDVNPVTFGTPSELALGANCKSSAEVSGNTFNEQIGCRATAASYPYKPLQDAVAEDANFIRNAGVTKKFGKLDGENYYYISRRLASSMRAYTMNVVLFMPEKDVLGDIVQGRNVAIGVTVAVFVVASIITFVIIGLVLSPVDDVARKMYLTAQLSSDREMSNIKDAAQDDGALNGPGNHSSNDMLRGDTSIYVADNDGDDDGIDHDYDKSSLAEIRALQTAYATMDTAIRSFTKYVPRDVVKELMASGQMCEIQMRPQRCSMLFTDIASFTSICERVPPHILSGLVRLYFERASSIVMGHGGMIDKFIGDCIMAVWSAPVQIDHHELRAAICAHVLVHETEQNPLRGAFEDVGEKLAIRVGVASGEVLAGNMGSRMRMNYTVIGDDVNLASRLEGLNKQWGTSVFVSEDTAEECETVLHLRYMISIAVVGKTEPVKVFEVMGLRSDAANMTFGNDSATTEASETKTASQGTRDREFADLAQRYGEVGGETKITSVSKLVRKALRRHQVTDAELGFAAVYMEAVRAWDAGDFGTCVSKLRGIAEDATMPPRAFERLSVQRVLHAAEENLKTPPAGVWTGVWTATEK